MLWLMVAFAIIGLPPVPGSTFSWDGFNGFGVAGLLLLLLCCWIGPAARAGYSVHSLRLHIGASLVLVLGVAIHAVGLFFSNDVMIEYLKWRAPLYMHAGNLGFALMLVVSLVSVRNVRRRLHSHFNAFRDAHRLLSALIVFLTGWHVIGSGYLAGAGHGAATAWTEHSQLAGTDYWRGWLLAIALLLTTVLWWQQADRARQPSATSRATLYKSSGLLLLTLLGSTAAYLAALRVPTLGGAE